MIGSVFHDKFSIRQDDKQIANKVSQEEATVCRLLRNFNRP